MAIVVCAVILYTEIFDFQQRRGEQCTGPGALPSPGSSVTRSDAKLTMASVSVKEKLLDMTEVMESGYVISLYSLPFYVSFELRLGFVFRRRGGGGRPL